MRVTSGMAARRRASARARRERSEETLGRRITDELKVGETVEDAVQHRLDLDPGQGGAEAVMGPDAEGEVVIRGPGDVEAERIREMRFVLVRNS